MWFQLQRNVFVCLCMCVFMCLLSLITLMYTYIYFKMYKFTMHMLYRKWKTCYFVGRKRKWFPINEALDLLSIHKPVQCSYLKLLTRNDKVPWHTSSFVNLLIQVTKDWKLQPPWALERKILIFMLIVETYENLVLI